MVSFLKYGVDICRLIYASRRCQLFGVGNIHMRPHVVRPVAQADLQVSVAEDFLLVAKDRVRKFWVESIDETKPRFRGRNEAHAERIVGVDDPCQEFSVEHGGFWYRETAVGRRRLTVGQVR